MRGQLILQGEDGLAWGSTYRLSTSLHHCLEAPSQIEFGGTYLDRYCTHSIFLWRAPTWMPLYFGIWVALVPFSLKIKDLCPAENPSFSINLTTTTSTHFTRRDHLVIRSQGDLCSSLREYFIQVCSLLDFVPQSWIMSCQQLSTAASAITCLPAQHNIDFF